jgi:hypothetical protein
MLPGSGTAVRVAVVICPLPMAVTGVTGLLPIAPGARFEIPFADAKPVAPLKMPVPPRIEYVFVKVGKPAEFGGPNTVLFVPLNVFVPPSKENVKVFIVEAGANPPMGRAAKVTVPASV